jgi:hypothetical protein
MHQDEFLPFAQAHDRIMAKIEKKVKSFLGRGNLSAAASKDCGNRGEPGSLLSGSNLQAKTTV